MRNAMCEESETGSEVEVEAADTHSTELVGARGVNLAKTRAGGQRNGALAGCSADCNVASARHAGDLLVLLLADGEVRAAESSKSGWS